MSAPGGKNDPGNQNASASGSSGDQKTYKEAATEFYNRQYENWVPWMEDQYLKYFTKDNKASYATKRASSRSPSPLHTARLETEMNRH